MLALAFSGGKDSMACLHLLREELDCAIYIDTGFSYPETREMVNYAASLVPMHIVQSDRTAQQARSGYPADIVPVEWTAVGQAMTHRKSVMIQPSVLCCYENLALPLLVKAKALGVTRLVYGQRAEELHRGTAKNGDLIDGILRLHPIEDWTRQQVLDYLATKMTVPPHFSFQHSSLDCYDCTAFMAQSIDRIAWMKERYPVQYVSYATRANAITDCLAEALQGARS